MRYSAFSSISLFYKLNQQEARGRGKSNGSFYSDIYQTFRNQTLNDNIKQRNKMTFWVIQTNLWFFEGGYLVEQLECPYPYQGSNPSSAPDPGFLLIPTLAAATVTASEAGTLLPMWETCQLLALAWPCHSNNGGTEPTPNHHPNKTMLWALLLWQ